MRLVVLPLSQGPQALSRILLLFEQLIENLHGLLIGYDALAIKLVLPVFESDDILEVALCLNRIFGLIA